jgi:hypothetical protein
LASEDEQAKESGDDTTGDEVDAQAEASFDDNESGTAGPRFLFAKAPRLPKPRPGSYKALLKLEIEATEEKPATDKTKKRKEIGQKEVEDAEDPASDDSGEVKKKRKVKESGKRKSDKGKNTKGKK